MLVVGDLNQLPLVKDKPVFQVYSRNEMASFFDINPLRDSFEFFELTEIMRQKDDLSFIHALNHLAVGKLRDEDMQLIRYREVKIREDIPETAIRLYATNNNNITK